MIHSASHANCVDSLYLPHDALTIFQLVPTINGYKRLVAGEAFWAPNAVTYGYDSRGASVRIISPPSVAPAATRLEVRVPGADMNPYFAISAIFALGIRGIEKKLKLTVRPFGKITPEDKKNGKVVVDEHFRNFKLKLGRSRCYHSRWRRPRLE